MNQLNQNLNQAERRAQIIACLKENGNVRVSELSELFSMSEVTIRNDLAELEKADMLKRVHGGAIQTIKNYYALDANERLNERKTEKMQIAVQVRDLISDGDSIVMNSGSTNFYIASELVNKNNLRVITNSIQIAEIFSARHDIEVILLGGNINLRYMFTHGDDAYHQLQKYKVNKSILSADGVDLDSGVTTYHNEVARLLNLMIERAAVNIIAADHTKLGHTAFSKVVAIDKVDYLVTDQKSRTLSAKALNIEQFEKLKIKVLTGK